MSESEKPETPPDKPRSLRVRLLMIGTILLLLISTVFLMNHYLFGSQTLLTRLGSLFYFDNSPTIDPSRTINIFSLDPLNINFGENKSYTSSMSLSFDVSSHYLARDQKFVHCPSAQPEDSLLGPHIDQCKTLIAEEITKLVASHDFVDQINEGDYNPNILLVQLRDKITRLVATLISPVELRAVFISRFSLSQ